MSPKVSAQRLEGQREITQPEWAEFLAGPADGEAPACRETPLLVTRWRGSADNDTSCADPAIEVESWARHASTASGFGDVATAAWPTSYEAHQLARVHRALVLGRIIAAAIRGVVAMARRVRAFRQGRQEANALYDALRQMDDRTLRDLGFHRSEISPAGVDVSGCMPTFWASHGPMR